MTTAAQMELWARQWRALSLSYPERVLVSPTVTRSGRVSSPEFTNEADRERERQRLIGERDRLIDTINAQMDLYGLRVSPGWQPFDPVVRQGGTAHTYAVLAAWGSGQPDGGAAMADLFRRWEQGTVTFEQLPAQLRALGLITHFAEAARGYGAAVQHSLPEWMDRIADAETTEDAQETWNAYREQFSPSLKFREDSSMDWSPST